MPKKPLEVIGEHFSRVADPCVDRTKEHKLIDIIAIAICAVICGAEGWVMAKANSPDWVCFLNYRTEFLRMIRLGGFFR